MYQWLFSVRSPVTGLLAQNLSCKTIAVVGATGGVGLETVYQALGSGYKVRALARSPEKLVIPPGACELGRSLQHRAS
jgi:NAD(P)-dependent dehydrogenase (short-subunit alcohol dehydrogenase family)